MSPSLPGFRFRLFGFPVTIGIDFLLITVLIGLQSRPGVYILEWVAVVAVSILIHELGHAFAVSRYGINPEIRLWGMGGLTTYGFALAPRKSIIVSLAGPLVGIPVAVVVMVIKPWLPVSEPVAMIANDLVFVNLWWGILNLLPLAGLDGGNVTTSLFLIAMGERGRRPGLAFVGLASVVVAVVAAFIGFIYLTVVIVFFALMSPEPYLVLWRMLNGATDRSGGASAPSRAGSTGRPGRGNASGGSLFARAAASANEPRKKGKDGPAPFDMAAARRVFPELYADVVTPPGGPGLDLDGFESRPSPLLADVIAMVARKDDIAVAARLNDETDPLAVLGIVARVVDAKRVVPLLSLLRRGGPPDNTPALLKLQVGLHALGQFEAALAAAAAAAGCGGVGGVGSAVLEARSAARAGDRKRTEAAIDLGAPNLSEDALGDIARLGADRRIADLLAQMRRAAPAP
jgi:Zn-dependent protease